MEITLKLHVEEVNFILNALGNLPSSSGVYPLLVKIKEQGEHALGDVTPVEEPVEA